MRMNISILLCILLTLVPLQANAQEEPSGRLFLINGQVLSVEIISLNDRTVIYKTAQNRKNELNKIPLTSIYILIGPSGEILIRNFEHKKEFLGNYTGELSKLERYVLEESLFSYIPLKSNSKWLIELTSGKTYDDGIIQELYENILMFKSSLTSHNIEISDINKIYIEKYKEGGNSFLKGMKRGGKLGLGLGVATALLGMSNGEPSILIIIVPIPFTIIGALGGGILSLGSGNTSNIDTYLLGEMTLIEKNIMIYNLLVVQDRQE